MDPVWAVAFLAILSVFLAFVLAVANRWLTVEEDPRIEMVADALPGANCGACGFPGCQAFAEQVVAGAVLPGQCSVGGQERAQYIASLLGIEAGSSEKKVARLQCAGGSDVAIQVSEYEGYSSCRAAATVGGGFKGCSYGCLGLGDCMVACTFDAISMAPNGLPVVDFDKCTGCGDCVRACPKGLFEVMPAERKLLVQCKSLLEGDSVSEYCKVGCTACARCAADAPEGLIEMKRNLPVIDSNHLELQTKLATTRCPTGAIVWIEGQQFPDLYKKMKESEVTYRAI